jgi:hypothetical protein
MGRRKRAMSQIHEGLKEAAKEVELSNNVYKKALVQHRKAENKLKYGQLIIVTWNKPY